MIFSPETARELARGTYKKILDGIVVAHTFSAPDGSGTVNLVAPGIDPQALIVDFEAKALAGLVPVFIYYLLPAGGTFGTNRDFILFETTLGPRKVVGLTPFEGTSADAGLRTHLRTACATVYIEEVADKFSQFVRDARGGAEKVKKKDKTYGRWKKVGWTWSVYTAFQPTPGRAILLRKKTETFDGCCSPRRCISMMEGRRGGYSK